MNTQSVLPADESQTFWKRMLWIFFVLLNFSNTTETTNSELSVWMDERVA